MGRGSCVCSVLFETFIMKESAFRITRIHPKSQRNCILLKFQNGVLKPTKKIACGLYKNKKNKRRRRALITVDSQLYTGDEEENEMCRSFILARNRKTGDARLIEVSNVTVRAVTHLEVKEKEDDVDSKKEEKPWTSHDLNKAFGSKKQKRRTEQQLKLSVDVSTLSSQLNDTIENLDQSANDIEEYTAKNDNSDTYLPSINRNAKSVDDVYKIENLLTTTEIAAIKEELSGVDYVKEMPPYIARIIEQKPDPEITDRSCLLLYASSLINFYLSDAKMVTTHKYVPCSSSPTISKIILEKFIVVAGNKRMRPLQMRDKTACYIMVIMLLCCSYKFDLGALEVVLKRKLPSILRMVGGQVLKDGATTTAVLRLPLAILATKRIRRKN